MIDKYSEIIIMIILNKKIKQINWQEIDFVKLLIQASHNRVLYLFAKNLLNSAIYLPTEKKKILIDIKKEGEKNLNALKDTLLLLENIFKKENINYLIVKTFKYLDYVTFDVDFLVKYEEFDKIIAVLKKNNLKVEPHPNPKTQGLHQKNCFKTGYLKMDLHRKFFWLGIEHIDLDFVWQNTSHKKIAGINCPIPSLETDFLLHNKQLIYERGYVTLLDFLAVKYANDQGLNWHKIMEQVITHKWDKTFFVLLNWLNYMHQEIFNDKMVNLNKYFPQKKYKITKKELKLPLIYPVKEILKVFKEIGLTHKHFPWLELIYYFFSKSRYLINNRIPFYDHWYDFNKIKPGKYKVANCIN